MAGARRNTASSKGRAALEPARLRESLGRIPCLGALDARGIDTLAGLVRSARHPKGKLLARQGEAQGAMYQILSGRVRLYRVGPEGREQNLWVRGAGECFCLSPLDPELESPFTVECVADTELLVLDPRTSRELLGTGSAFDSGVVRCLGERLADLARLAESLTSSPVPARLAATLLDLAERQGHDERGACVVTPITHDELANSVGTAREVVSRTLKRFAEAGWIRVARGSITILDRDALAAEPLGNA